MATSSANFTAGQIADFSAALLNDPFKTDYTFEVLKRFIMMAYYELVDYQMDGQQPPLNYTSPPILVAKGIDIVYAIHHAPALTPNYPGDLCEIQELGERAAGTTELYTPMKRTEFLGYLGQPSEKLRFWTWENESIKFPTGGASTNREIQFKILRGLPADFLPIPESVVAGHNTHTYLMYKTAALAAMFVGENKERAEVLEAHAHRALEMMESIDNKGRQQIMTRHRPFRAAWKARGGY